MTESVHAARLLPRSAPETVGRGILDRMDGPLLVLLANVAATWFMTGVIWFVQVVHYPLFAAVGEAGFGAYATAHARRTGWVVAPPMLLELATGVLLALRPPPGVSPLLAWLGLALLAIIWGSTAAVQMPRHAALGGGFDAAGIASLVATNWLRTAAWTLRALLVLLMVGGVVR